MRCHAARYARRDARYMRVRVPVRPRALLKSGLLRYAPRDALYALPRVGYAMTFICQRSALIIDHDE